MEVVIRTSHGGADVDVASFDDDTTLRELIEYVTGLGVPAVVSVDGHPCRADDTIVETIERMGLRIGSTIDVSGERLGVGPGRIDAGDDGDDGPLVALRQLSGRGAGTVVDLPAGNFRFGAGRRLIEQELSMSIVEEEAFTVAVTAAGRRDVDEHEARHDVETDARVDPRSVTVTVRPGANVAGELGAFTPMLGGQLFDRELPWTTQRLSVGGRVFDLVPLADPSDAADSTSAIGLARIGRPDRDGVRSFDAAGTIAVLDDAAPDVELATIDALDRITDTARTLWRYRPNERGLRLPIGLTADHTETVSIDLDRYAGIAVSGAGDFTIGVARTLLVELATTLGPGDLEIVIVASAGRLARWDWTKWLPHVRRGDPTQTPRFVQTFDDAEAWLATVPEFARDHDAADGNGDATADAAADAAAGSIDTTGGTVRPLLPPPAGRPHARPSPHTLRRHTVLVVDDAASWMRRDSPLRTLLVDPPTSVKVIATTDVVNDAPSSCTALIDELPPEGALLEHSAAVPDGAGAEGTDAAHHSTAATRLFGSLCRLIERLGVNPLVTTDVRPAITQGATAAEIARSIACYDDLRVRRDGGGAEGLPRADRPTLGDLLALASSEPHEDRPPTQVPIGRVVDPERPAPPSAAMSLPLPDEVAASIDLARAEITGLAVDAADSNQLLGAIVLGAAARHDQEGLAILVVADDEPEWLGALPQLLGTVRGDDSDEIGRVLRRLATTMSDEPDIDVLVVVEHAIAGDGPTRLSDASVAFMELAESLGRVHLVLATDIEHANVLRRHLGVRCGAFVEGRRDGTATLTRGDGLTLGTARIMATVEVALPVVRSAPPPAPTHGLRVRPFVHGRPLSPIERRLARRSMSEQPLAPGTAVSALVPETAGVGATDAVAHDGGRSADGAGSMPADAGTSDVVGATTAESAVVPPFPARIGQESLLPALDASATDSDTGDDGRERHALAVGIIAGDEGIDVFRWRPTSGNLLVVGHRRSGMGVLSDLIAVAATDVDVALWVLDTLPQRRRAFRRLPGCRRTAPPESAVAVERFLDDVEAHLADPDPDTPTVIVVGDLNRTLVPFDDQAGERMLDRLASLARPAVDGVDAGVSIVAAGSRHREVAPLIAGAADVLVGDIDDRDRRELGAPAGLEWGDAGARGRCWSTGRERPVQLADAPDDLERFIRARLEIREATSDTADGTEAST